MAWQSFTWPCLLILSLPLHSIFLATEKSFLFTLSEVLCPRRRSSDFFTFMPLVSHASSRQTATHVPGPGAAVLCCRPSPLTPQGSRWASSTWPPNTLFSSVKASTKLHLLLYPIVKKHGWPHVTTFCHPCSPLQRCTAERKYTSTTDKSFPSYLRNYWHKEQEPYLTQIAWPPT